MNNRIRTSFTTDRILGISAMIISLLTLIIFIYQTQIMHKQSRLSVTPRLDFTVSEGNQDTLIYFKMDLLNKGLGPAIIEEIVILHNDKRYPLNFDTFLDEVFPELDKYGYLTQSMTMTKGSTLAPGERNSLFTFMIYPNSILELLDYLQVEGEEDPFEIEVIYSSIYQEQWKTSNTKGGHPEKL